MGTRCSALLLLVVVLSVLVFASASQAAAPVIQSVWIDRGRDTDAPDWACYHQRVQVIASDADGAGDIVGVEIDDPASGIHYISISDGQGWPVDANTVGCEWSEWELLSPPAAGVYSVTVWDWDGNSDSLTTVPAPAVSEVRPELLTPVMDSVIYDTRPTFEWTAGQPDSCYGIHVEEEGTLGEVWSAWVGDQTQCVYRFDEPDPVEELQPGHSYFWKIESYSPINDGDPDPRVCITNGQFTGGRFTVYEAWPGLPALPGKIAYNSTFWGETVPGWYPNFGMSSIQAYNPDPAQRLWLAPLGAAFPDWASNPEWSPDGSKLMYSKSNAIWIDYQDGNPPVQVPGVSGWGDCRWSPDGDRIIYTVSGPWSPYTPFNDDIWIANADGSDAHPLVDSIYNQDRYPVWSPDGLWIAYRKLHPTVGQGLSLIRYDGADDHSLIATGVVGYPDYVVGYMGEHAWSPDGTKLVTLFGADSSYGSIMGIGIIPREGGMIQPVFVAPEGAICCAHPHLPQWSPDQSQIIFTSGHQLSSFPAWGEFSTGPELWLMNADASGEPTRLTYDYAFNAYISWWAPNTETGDDVSVSKGDTTVTFDNITETGSTSVTVFNEPPGPDPGGFTFLGDYWEINTTAEFTGPVTIEIHYDDADVPGGEEEWLALLHWENGEWVDITVRPIDTLNNIIRGQCTSLSPFGVAFGPQFQGLLQPVNNDGSSVFKLGRTVPMKFQLVAPGGAYVTDAVARLYVAQVSNQVVGTYQEASSTGQADSGNTFRYDPTANQYIFNWGTKGLAKGTWVVQVVVNDLVAKEVLVSLK